MTPLKCALYLLFLMFVSKEINECQNTVNGDRKVICTYTRVYKKNFYK